jgi:TetR/AcrR family transcriptional regulator, tetracycline repressor protein
MSTGDFVEAAIEFLDTHTHDALTTRALGDHMGIDHTALYRHFPNKDALLSAVVDHVLSEVAVDDGPANDGPADAGATTAREYLERLAHAVRRMFRYHPNIGGVIANTTGTSDNAVRVTRAALDGLRRLGLQGPDLVRCYQAYESYLIGSSMFDMSGAPHHMDVRRNRYRAIEAAEFDDVSRTMDTVNDAAEQAYATGVRALLDHFETVAAA